jgi:acetylornithine deacetylase/succinyl-diaminopimelate desuccinylase-like protein
MPIKMERMSTPNFDFDKEEAYQLLRQLVAIRSYPGEEAEAQRACAAWLAQNNIASHLQITQNGQPNVIARIENGPGPTLMLNGHMDTVLRAQGWLHDPWQGWREGDIFYGLGAADMKCGVVANMLVARALATHKHQWRGTLIFSCVTDEEAYSYGARALVDVNRGGVKADACLVSEPHYVGGAIGAAGKVLVQVDVTGKAAHGFLPWQGVNAGIEAARFAAEVCNAVPELKHPQVPSSQTVLSIHAGSEQYVITLPETARVLITRQTVPGETRDSVLDKMRGFAASLNSPAKFEFSNPAPYYAPWAFDDPNHAFTQAFNAAYQAEHGSTPNLHYMFGISDANVFCGEAGIPSIVYGPRGDNFHQCQEWVDLASIPVFCRVALEMALRFFRFS